MKILFLDVDGVLNTKEDIKNNGPLYINPQLLSRLVSIIRATGAMIVIHSTWRLNSNKSLLLSYLKNVKLDQDIMGETPYLGDKSKEIQKWLESNHDLKIEKFAILDDSKIVGFDDSFFKTNFEFGLTNGIKHSIIEYLNDN